MQLDLFARNRQAYAQAAEMVAQTGKAAVIHPTDTGKSFIGFLLCADHPDKRICKEKKRKARRSYIPL